MEIFKFFFIKHEYGGKFDDYEVHLMHAWVGIATFFNHVCNSVCLNASSDVNMKDSEGDILFGMF